MEGFERRHSPVEQLGKTKKPVDSPWDILMTGSTSWDDFTTLPNPLDPIESSPPLDQTNGRMMTPEELRAMRREVGKCAMKVFKLVNGD